VKACLAACVSVVDKPISFCSTTHGAPGVLAIPLKLSLLAEAGEL